jgi:hypothetical protein
MECGDSVAASKERTAPPNEYKPGGDAIATVGWMPPPVSAIADKLDVIANTSLMTQVRTLTEEDSR